MIPAVGGRLAVPVSDREHSLGPADAPVTLVEYGDYECPYCGRAHYILQELLGLAGDRLRFVFRNFPLTAIHPHAQQAAEAAEAAGAQGRFWEMHDTLFENQDALDDEHLEHYAIQLELDLPRFVREMVAHVHAPRVRDDFLSGVRSGVNGTPTFFVNGLRYDGPHDLRSLLLAIELAASQTEALR